MGYPNISCPTCGTVGKWRHMADSVYGMSSTVMSGTERFECPCGHTVLASDNEAFMFPFRYDRVTSGGKEGEDA